MEKKFIVVHYPRLDFIISRAQLLAGAYLEESYPVKSRNPYFSSLAIVNREVMFVFDFNSFVQDKFLCPASPASRFLLISEHKSFSLNSLLLIKKMRTRPSTLPVSFRHFALKTGSEVEFRSFDTAEFKSLPAVFRSIYGEKGVTALRFNTGTLQYVLDLEKLFMHSLLWKVCAPP